MAIARRGNLPKRPVERWEDAPRVDALEKVTGRAKYIEDLPDLPGTVYAAPLYSPYSHAPIISLDSSGAERLPGVLAILDGEHLDGLDPHVRVGEYSGHTRQHGLTADHHFLTTDKARFDGDLIAMVAATDLRTARRAAELIEVEYELLPTVFSIGEALAPGAPLIHEDLGTNVAYESSFEWGDVERGWQEADRIFEASYTLPTVFHHPMEPAGSCLAHFAGDAVDLWLPTNSPFTPAHQVAELFGIDPDAVRVRVPYLGGHFGAKQFYPVHMAALALSRRLGRPVRVVATGEESFRTTARHAAEFKMKLGVRSDGTLVALDVDLAADTGAYFTGAAVVTRTMIISAWGCYRLPHFRVRARAVYTNKVPAGSFRATGKNETTFAIESMIDSVARQMGFDPLEFRNKNVLQRGEYIAERWKVGGEEFDADTPPIDTDFADMMRQAVEAIGWDGQPSRQAEAPGTNGPLARGKGMALSFRHGSQGSGRAYAMATIEANGTVKIAHAAPDLGEGVFNMISVVAARTLGIPQSQVRVLAPDTVHELHFEGTAAQRTTVLMGNAVRSACEALKRELIEAAAQARGGGPDEWRVEGGRLWRGETSYSFAEIVQAFALAPGVEGSARLKGMGAYSYAPSEDKAFGGLDHWAPGAAAVEIEVDRETGETRLVQLSVVADAGKVLHYTSARGQVEGGAIMGVGLGFFEELLYQEGQLQNADAFQYRLPQMRDLPAPDDFHVSMLENGDGPGPFGAKGMAQTSIPSISPAINNALLDAIGVQVQSPPITPEKILEALGVLEAGD